MTTAAVLGALAASAPDRRQPDVHVAPAGVAWLAAFGTGTDDDPLGAGGVTVPADPTLAALARDDAIAPGLERLRLGWMWFSGRVGADRDERDVCLPMLSRPVHLDAGRRRSGAVVMSAAGPWDLWSLLDDHAVAAALETAAVFGGAGPAGEPLAQQWAESVLAASGLPAARFEPAGSSRRAAEDGAPVVVVGYGVYAAEPLDLSRPRQSLTGWSGTPGTETTAFAALYGVGPGHEATPERPADEARVVRSPLALSERQRRIVASARSAGVTTVSGPPGTGKTQTAAAIALDAVAAGRSVLVATQSPVAAAVIADMLAAVPGPTPVLFGGGERSRTLADRLADGVAAAEPARRDDSSSEHAETLRRAIVADLDDVAASAEWERLRTLVPVAPKLLGPNPTVSPRVAAGLFATATSGASGWWGRWRSRRAGRRLRRLIGADVSIPLADLAGAVAAASTRERAERAARRTPGDGTARLHAYVDASEAADHEWARWLDAEARDRVGRGERRAVAALATALRVGHSLRRLRLAELDVPDLLRALPLWIGTLSDIEELLPASPGAFDLLILDEASQIDQISAAAGLLRARRAVVIGDPRQLRFVSFVPDRDVTAALADHGVTDLADRLDVRRVSAFDLAASSSPVVFLDEHFRSVPHLIGFSARRFYDDRLRIATRRPDNERALAIDVRRLDGERASGVNDLEVAAAVDEVTRWLAEDATTTVGVVSPYRAQADAIAEAVADAVDLHTLQRGRVRIGTVHGFQGGESDVVIASFGIGGATDRGRRFLEDPHLFNVLVTRARRRLVALVSGELPATGLLADYVRWAGQPPPVPVDEAAEDAWTRALADVLRDAGESVRPGYQVGRWTVDLVVGDEAPLAVATRVHPAGAAAHLERFVALHRAGWRQAEAFAVSTGADPVATALALRPGVTGGARHQP